MSCITLSLKPERDGVGFFYGVVSARGQIWPVDILPPLSFARPVVTLTRTKPDPDAWIVFVSGEEIARVGSRADVEPALRVHLERRT